MHRNLNINPSRHSEHSEESQPRQAIWRRSFATLRMTKLFLPIFFFIAGQVSAEEISVDRMVNDVIEHSPILKMAGDDVAAAEAVKKQADAVLFPSLDMDAGAAHYEGLKENNFPNFRIPAIPDRYNGGLSLTQPLYTGGKISGRKEMTAVQYHSARFSLAARRSDIVYQARCAYWGWSKAFYAAESFRAAVAWMEEHDRDMQNLFKNGLATENERLSTSVRLDQNRLNLEEALRRVNLSRAAIEQLTGKPLLPEAIPSKPSVGEVSSNLTEQILTQCALTNRPDVQAQQAALDAARKNIKVQSADYFPQLGARLRGEVGRPNQLNIPPEDTWQFDAFIGASASWNILDWGLTRGKVNEARARANQAAHQLSQVSEQVVYEVRQALINLDNAATRVRVARRAEESAKLDLKAATDLWKNGLARHSDVLDAQARYTDARFELVMACADVALARAELEHANGGTTGK